MDWGLGPSFGLILLFRVVNALLIGTFFQADEYWQALEPAHKLVYGYGYLTWEWKYGLRSYLHPLLYTAGYKVIETLPIRDENLRFNLIIVTPKIINGVIAAVGDYYLYLYALQKFKNNRRLANLVSFMSLFSAWNFYCWPRSFSNSLELTLTIVSLYCFEMHNYLLTLIIAAVTCLIRPTNAIIWLFQLPPVFLKYPRYILFSVVIGASMLLFDGLINYSIYGDFKIPLIAFFKFNISDNLSSFYGVSRLDFYFFQAIPILLLNFLPFFIYGFYITSWAKLKSLLLVYLAVFTFIPHKEFRFIYPMMPILLIYSATGLYKLSFKLSQKIYRSIIVITILLSTFIGIYFTRYHESGEYKIPFIIREQILKESPHSGHSIDVGFLTPCHSTPFQSHFHLSPELSNIWFLTCEPPLGLNIDLKDYKDESDYFYENPVLFLKQNFPQHISQSAKLSLEKDTKFPHTWPAYLIIFQDLWDNLEFRSYIENSYNVINDVWNAPFHWDSRRRGDLLILKLHETD